MAIESIVRALKTDIVAGKFAPGGKLPSLQEMQKIFGVGRGTIREALKVLEGMGLLEMKKGRTGGAFLTSRSNQIVAKSLADMFKVEEFNILSFIAFRKTIEPRIVRQAVLERKAHDQEDMKAALDLLSEEAISRETFLTATSGFYRAIASANQNQYLEGLFEYTLPALAETCKLLYEIPVVVDLSKHFYWQIYQAILEGDPEKGEMIVEGYLLQLEDKVKKAKSLGVRPAGSNGVIKWGFMADLSGTLMDYGKQCATGMMDAARYINETGGINGKKIELIIVDDKYKVSESRKAYDSFKNSGVQGIYIQSTGAAQFLIPLRMSIAGTRKMNMPAWRRNACLIVGWIN